MKRVVISLSIVLVVLSFSFAQKTGTRDPYEGEPCVYVSPNGSDENPGTKALPFRTIEVAIDKGVIFGVNVIKVAEGVYTPGKGLNTGFSGVAIKHHNIKLIGGYNQDFTAITGYSILNGERKVQAIIEVRGATNALIENFVVMGATNREKNDKNGGGVYLNKSSFSTLRNIISSNNMVGNGAGICIIGDSNKIVDVRVLNNFGENGSGGYIVGNYNEISSSIFQSNVAGIWGGGLLLGGISNVVKNSQFLNNSSREGGGIYIDKGIGNQILDSQIKNNSSQNSGGGIFVNVGAGNIIKSTVEQNLSRDGGGIYGFKTTSLQIESTISENTATRNGGGIFLESTYKNIVNSTISKNTAQANGGGVFLRGEENSILGTIIDNKASQNAGGIYITGFKNTITSRIQNNTSQSNGGGVFVELSRNTIIDNSEISGNTAENIGGGIYSLKDIDPLINNTKIVNNTSKLHGGGIAIFDSTNSSLFNLDITQNKAETTNSIVYLYKTEGIINLIISNCTISSKTGEKGIGIYEDGLNDIILHKLIDNTFVVDTLQGGLYRDFKLDTTWLITAVNNPKFSGASEARGNKQR